MKLNIRFYATLKEHIGESQLMIDLPESSTVKDLLTVLVQNHPELKPTLESVIIAVNRDFANLDQSLTPNDEVVLFPPVSGGYIC